MVDEVPLFSMTFDLGMKFVEWLLGDTTFNVLVSSASPVQVERPLNEVGKSGWGSAAAVEALYSVRSSTAAAAAVAASDGLHTLVDSGVHDLVLDREDRPDIPVACPRVSGMSRQDGWTSLAMSLTMWRLIPTCPSSLRSLLQ